MAVTQKYLGAETPFGTITYVEDRLFNAQVTVIREDGSTKTYALPFLIAQGLTLLEVPLATSPDLLTEEV